MPRALPQPHRMPQSSEIVLCGIHVGRPRTHVDSEGSWDSAINRLVATGPVAVGTDGLEGDAVCDIVHHGGPDQAVCCHPLSHYVHWNDFYGLAGDALLGPGAVGENWTVDGADESDFCIGDTFTVG